MALATIAGAQLTAALKPQLTLLVDDMRERLNADPHELENWRVTHREAVREQRTATSWTDWSEDQLTQAAVGWLLTSVFVRFCEDNLLLGETAVWIAGPTALLRQRAVDAENSFYREHQDCSYREWLEQSFDALRNNPATQALVDEHAALNIIAPSSDSVQQLLGFWRQTEDTGELVWSFQDETLSTRFLGDLYQELSDFAKKKYALLQTPEFVEEFILDQTLEPALKDRPLEGFKLIDPTCGSGHFLLGAFARLVDLWHRHAPSVELRVRVDNALSSVYGVDLNPFAVAIAKFRLIVAAMNACEEVSLVDLPKFTLNLAVGDSLLFGPDEDGQNFIDYDDPIVDKDIVASNFAYSTEDARLLRKMLTPGQYDVVVGNPPYILASDKALNARYRSRYKQYCKGKYALTVPFMVKFFDLAKPGDRAGWIGQITSNSFMKREFGVPLIEDFLTQRDLRLVADTSGAYIPGHGTPTVILVGRNQPSVRGTVKAVLGIQGEPGAPEHPEKGLVWTSIVEHISKTEHEDQWISIRDLPRDNLRQHPWSLSGGGAVELAAAIDQAKHYRLADLLGTIGFVAITAEDEAFFLSDRSAVRRLGIEQSLPMVEGNVVRDFSIESQIISIWPYDRNLEASTEPWIREYLWPLRRVLQRRKRFGTYIEQIPSIKWWEYGELYKNKLKAPCSIAFAFVATHNHFVLDRGGKVFKQSAPVIKLPEGASEDDHLGLLGTLNSSTACFWLKQNSHDKGSEGYQSGIKTERWERFYEFTGTTLKDFPHAAAAPLERARLLDMLAAQLATQDPASVIEATGVTRSALGAARIEHDRLRAEMIAEQDELDWEVYRHYGLIDEDLTIPPGQALGIALGQRAFEIALARKVEGGEGDTEWFTRHRSTLVTEIPAHWPAEYRGLVEKRLAAIEDNPFVRLLESPEYKRRWTGESWDAKLHRALDDWLLDKLEDQTLWFTPQGTPIPRSVGELAGHVEKDPEFIEALDLWADQKDAPVTDTLVKLLADKAVPYLAALRYKDSGLRKRAEWERVWDLQRDEDAGLIKATDIPVPPKYTSTDFLKSSYWSHRGKLDVPKERFISYPDAGRDTDPTPLLGWAGWNHAQQGLALATIYALRESEGMPLAQLVPVVAGIAEVLPWVKQWHSGVDPHLGVDLAEYLSSQLAEKSAAVGVPVQGLPEWRPEKKTRGRKATARKAGQ
jgi:hypothetical protein